ncbi:MAG: DUF1570 domain-containing protein, partial [Verrucomicrobia bacterium]|nr:DUF1570 domain-containing protein [Verrucomicrobiota bacterium]
MRFFPAAATRSAVSVALLLRRMRWLGALLLTAVAAGAADDWRYVRTENFELVSQASEKKTRKIVADLEQFRASFIASFHLRPAHEPRVSVVLFDSDKRFTPFKPRYQGKPKEVAGYFVGGEDETVIALNLDVPTDEESNPVETIFHEYLHLLLHTRGMKLPTWLNEGLAEVFSTFRVEGNTVVYGRPKQIYVDLLGVSPLMPMGQMMAVTESSPDYNEEQRAGMFYAQAWALTHFLVCGEDRTNAAKLAKFLAIMDTGPADPEAAFVEVFGFNFDQLEQLLRNYLQGGRYFVRRMPVQLMDFENRVEFRTASEEERDLALINLHWRVHRTGDAKPAALQLAERDPGSPRPQELLGAMAAVDRDVRVALTRWRRAAELGSTSAYVLVQASRTKLVEIGGVLDPDRQLRAADVVELREWLDRAVQLSPYYDDAWEMLAHVESRAADFRNGVVNDIQNRVNAMKEPGLTLLALAVIRWRAKDLATANEIIKAVTTSPKMRRDIKSIAYALQRRFALDGPVAGRKAPASAGAAADASEPG